MKNLKVSLGVFSVTIQLIQFVNCHVSMTFPPARTFSLDFLNSFWTKQPCGMPKGTIRTSLVAGQSFNATWHLGYAHQGGYRLELLDSQDNKVMDLTPTDDSEFYQGKTTAQWHVIDVPSNLTCQDCTIRLLRQVPEFAPNFYFWSCSDVDILSKDRYVETCSGHGYQAGSHCNCYRRYWGNRCQYEDECETDNDCNINGKCVHLGGSALPRRQCFCSSGYFGERCAKSNPFSMPKDQSVDLSKHLKVPLAERMTMFFKPIIATHEEDDEMEFVLQINGTSYAGLGWRPVNLGPICKSWPFIHDALVVETNAKPSKQQKNKRSATFTITKSVDQSDRFEDGGNSQGYSSGSVPLARTVSSAATNKPHGHSHRHPQVVQIITETPSVVSTLVEVSHSDSIPPPPPSTRHQSSSPPAQTLQPLREPKQRTPSEWAAQDPFTPMDCTDIVMGAARENYSRIRDAYSRGRHTPKVDSTWGGTDDLTGATGWEKDGITTLMFRRKVRSNDGPDHSLRGEMLVIWARGQQPGEHVANPHFQLERDNSVASHFYTVDEYKYHGLGPQRGLIYIDFTAAKNEFRSRFL